ncbi:MAG: CBS domain-containing protein, partial [Candidatus Aerophobetes bacterium]|nr:CBS domain-containing protein [Candidatus Aerophobetes bacterium]
MKGGKMFVKEAMRRDVITVKESTTLKELMEIFYKYTFHTLPVVREDKKVVGVVALEDICKIFYPHPPHILRMLERTPLWNGYEEKNLLEVDIPSEMGT